MRLKKLNKKYCSSINIELNYGAKIKPDGKGFLVTFRNISNAFTYGDTYEEVILNAREVLDLTLLDRLEKNEQIPKPSALRKNELAIAPSPDITTRILLQLKITRPQQRL